MIRACEDTAGPNARTDGYTLLELLVVILILAMIIGIAAPKAIGYFGQSKTKTAGIQIANIVAALDLYHLDVGRYPTSDQGLKALLEAPAGVKNWDGPYLMHRDGILDPWGSPYRYTPPGANGQAIVMTYGADGKPGGSGEDSDVTSDH